MTAPDAIPDFRDVVADLDQLSRQWQARSEEMAAALSQAEREISRPEFVLRAMGGRVLALTFTSRAPSASPVQLREAVLNAYAESTVRAANDQANAVATILGDAEMAAGLRQSVPSEVGDRAKDVELIEQEAQPSAPPRSRPRPPVEEFLDDPALDDEIVSADLIETMSDVEGWHPGLLGRIDPGNTQYELETELSALSQGAATLRTAMVEVTETAESTYLTVSVNAAGGLVDIVFRPAFRGVGHAALSADFTELYNTATAAATQRALGLVGDSGLAGEADPSVSWLDGVAQAAREQLDTGPSDRPRAD